MIHFVKNIPIADNHSEEFKEIIFGAGCFWGVEKRFWDIQGVYLTSVGYSGGNTKDPTYEDVCYKNTNHAEVVKIIYDPKIIELNKLIPPRAQNLDHPFGKYYLSESSIKKILPLLSKQDYLKRVDIFKNQEIDINLNLFREFAINFNNLE